MKKFLILFIIATLVAVMPSCTKYDDGGYASKNHLKGTWLLQELSYGGESSDVSIMNTYLTGITFEKNGTGNIDINLLVTTLTVDFNWEFVNDKKDLKMTLKPINFPAIIPQATRDQINEMIQTLLPAESHILKLTKSEFWITSIGDNKTMIMKLKKK
ncbi:MAG: hypothetical protein LBV69_05970 [Bacteroidales bacterium]|nr:hypothetical protein [Bacteroidales bacterium]